MVIPPQMAPFYQSQSHINHDVLIKPSNNYITLFVLFQKKLSNPIIPDFSAIYITHHLSTEAFLASSAASCCVGRGGNIRQTTQSTAKLP